MEVDIIHDGSLNIVKWLIDIDAASDFDFNPEIFQKRTAGKS